MNEEKKIKRIFKKRKILGQNYEKLLDIIEDNLDFFLNLTYDIKLAISSEPNLSKQSIKDISYIRDLKEKNK